MAILIIEAEKHYFRSVSKPVFSYSDVLSPQNKVHTEQKTNGWNILYSELQSNSKNDFFLKANYAFEFKAKSLWLTSLFF